MVAEHLQTQSRMYLLFEGQCLHSAFLWQERVGCWHLAVSMTTTSEKYLAQISTLIAVNDKLGLPLCIIYLSFYFFDMFFPP